MASRTTRAAPRRWRCRPEPGRARRRLLGRRSPRGRRTGRAPRWRAPTRSPGAGRSGAATAERGRLAAGPLVATARRRRPGRAGRHGFRELQADLEVGVGPGLEPAEQLEDQAVAEHERRVALLRRRLAPHGQRLEPAVHLLHGGHCRRRVRPTPRRAGRERPAPARSPRGGRGPAARRRSRRAGRPCARRSCARARSRGRLRRLLGRRSRIRDERQEVRARCRHRRRRPRRW